MTTTVFTPPDHAGGLDSQLSTSYSTARAGGTITNPATALLGQYKAGSNYRCSEMVVDFDTSALSGQVVSSVTLAVYVFIDSSTTDFTIEARLLSGYTSPITGNWVAGASLGGNSLMATFNTSGISGAGYYSFTSEAGFPAGVNLTGSTVLLLSSDRHRLGTTPTGNEFIYPRTLTAGQEPKLTVVHANPAPDPVTGTAASSLRPLTSAASGGQSQSGAMVSALQPLSASAAGYEHARGAIAASLRPLTADLNDRLDNTIVSALAPLTAALSGTQSQSGAVAASLQPLALSITGAYLGIVQSTVRPGWSGGAPGPLRPRRGSARR